MKKIVVIYKGDDWAKEVPINAEATRKSFEDWHIRGLKNGVEMYRASIKWYDHDKGVFEKAWAYRDGKWQKYTKSIKPDLMFDKIMSKRDYELYNWKIKVSKKVKIYNNPVFRTILDNKLSQYLIFKEFMASTYIVNSKKELPESLKKITTSKVVIKPLYGSGGFGIIICQKNDATKKRIEYPVIIQDFIKTAGIPGISKKSDIADLRLVFVNHKLLYSLSRIAKKGSLFTNFHQGATAVLVEKKQIPRSVFKVVDLVQKKLKIFGEANYSLDFLFDDKSKPWLVEMNTTPGFDLLEIIGDEKTKKSYFEAIIRNIS